MLFTVRTWDMFMYQSMLGFWDDDHFAFIYMHMHYIYALYMKNVDFLWMWDLCMCNHVTCTYVIGTKQAFGKKNDWFWPLCLFIVLFIINENLWCCHLDFYHFRKIIDGLWCSCFFVYALESTPYDHIRSLLMFPASNNYFLKHKF